MTGKGDGLYSCSYAPASPIKHTLALTWGGVGIPGSPFRVSSQSRPPVTAAALEPEFLFEAKRIELVSADRAKTSKRSEAPGKKAKKPLIVIVTCTEERYSC